ncbi:MAG: CoA pyrophosphatase [Deltaproteobacteria bacterium]|nr:CoA pyrophosphatase [Deltaproteobacteria bacterium]
MSARARSSRFSAAVLPRLRAALAAPPPLSETPPGIASAVLVPLFERDGVLHLLYTKRSESLPHHRGQVSFPGGRHVADADPTLLATALRETEEEIGVAPAHVDVLGALAPIHTSSSNFLINPFVGVIPHPYAFHPNPHEVSEIFSVPVDVLLHPSTGVEEAWTLQGRTVPVATYRHGAHVIWGATHRITTTLLDLLRTLRADA